MSETSEVSLDQAEVAEFRTNVIEYLRLPAEIKELEEPVKQAKSRKKELEQYVLDWMKTNKINHVTIPDEVGGGTLLTNNVVTKGTVKKENWSKGLVSYCRKRGLNEVDFEEFEKEVKDTLEPTVTTKLKKLKK